MTTKQNQRLLPQVEKMLDRAAGRRIENSRATASRSRASRRSRQTLAIVLVTLALSGTALGAVTGWNPLAHNDAVPSGRCSSFPSGNQLITVTPRVNLSCEKASAVIGAFWSPEDLAVHRGGKFTFNSYYTLKGFPGWRCYQAAGGGVCRRGKQVAGYEVLNPGQPLHTRPVTRPVNEPERFPVSWSLAIVTARGVGAVRLGDTIASLRRRHLIGPVGPGCDPGERSAGLQGRLRGVASFKRGRLTSISIRSGAETPKHVQVGSTLAEAKEAYPEAAYDPPKKFSSDVLWVNSRSHPRIALTTTSGNPNLVSEIYLPRPDFCE